MYYQKDYNQIVIFSYHEIILHDKFNLIFQNKYFHK